MFDKAFDRFVNGLTLIGLVIASLAVQTAWDWIEANGYVVYVVCSGLLLVEVIVLILCGRKAALTILIAGAVLFFTIFGTDLFRGGFSKHANAGIATALLLISVVGIGYLTDRFNKNKRP